MVTCKWTESCVNLKIWSPSLELVWERLVTRSCTDSCTYINFSYCMLQNKMWQKTKKIQHQSSHLVKTFRKTS